jgi:hypothetical protein
MNDAISRELGHFQSQSGRIYVLDVNVLADGSALTPGKPRLKVGVHPEVYEGNMVRGFIFLSLRGASQAVPIGMPRRSIVIVGDSSLLALQKSGWILLGNHQEP